MRKLIFLAALLIFMAGVPAYAQSSSLVTAQSPNQLSSGQIAAGQAAIAPPEIAVPDALIERRIKQSRRVNTVGAWAKVANEGGATAVYFTLRGGPEDDRLLSVNTPWARKAELHDTLADEKGVLRMRPIKTLLVSAHSELAFAPGGRHIMLMGLKRDLRRGAMFPVNLIFEKSGTVRAMVEIRGPAPGQQVQGSVPDEPPAAPAQEHQH